MLYLFIVTTVVFLALWLTSLHAVSILHDDVEHTKKELLEAHAKYSQLFEFYKKWKPCEDADKELQRLKQQCQNLTDRYNSEKGRLSAEIVRLKEIRTALENRINGYGGQYLVAAQDVLDSLAEELAHADAGQKLKEIKKEIRSTIKKNDAAVSEYEDKGQNSVARFFVTDAFMGKVDSIMVRVKSDNFGKLDREIQDAFTLTNMNATAFGNTKITPAFFSLIRTELRWAVACHELKEQMREEQRALREKMREEEKARKEYDKAQKEAQKEEEIAQKALAKARAEMEKAMEEQRKAIEQATAEQREALEKAAQEARVAHEKEIEELSAKLKQAEEKGQRAVSMAQQTKSGNVYIISNVGSFGENIYKIGMTRRLDPEDRVRELGDASVPFPFDIHAMIHSDDAPGLETKLHQHFILNQVNKVNRRREFFRVTIAELRAELDKLGIETSWTMTAEAREYQETQAIERELSKSEAARESWRNRQFDIPITVSDEDGDEED